jgi:hypothetical protein
MWTHPFGSIKQWMNQGAFLMKGLDNVRAEFSLTALVYNLRRALPRRRGLDGGCPGVKGRPCAAQTAPERHSWTPLGSRQAVFPATTRKMRRRASPAASLRNKRGFSHGLVELCNSPSALDEVPSWLYTSAKLSRAKTRTGSTPR